MEQKRLSVKANMLWNSAGSFAYLLLQWLLTVVIVRVAGYGANGEFSLAMSLTNVFAVIANYSMKNYQISDVKNKYTPGMYVASRYITCLIGFGCCAVFALINGYTKEQTIVIIVYMVFRISECFVDVFQSIDQKEWRMDIIGISMLLRGILSFVVFTGMLIVTQNLIFSIIGMTVAAYVVIVLYDIPKSKQLVTISYENAFAGIKKLLVECFPLVIYLAISNCITTIPRYFLEKMHSEDVLGIYAAIATPTVIVQVAASYLFSPLISVFAELIDKKDEKGFMKVFFKVVAAIAAVAVAAVVACVFLGEWGLNLLFDSEIVAYSYLLIPVMLCTVLNAFNWFLCALLTVMRDFKGLIIANVVAVLACVGASMLLIPTFAMDGVNYALYISLPIELVLLVVFGMVRLKKLVKEN